MIPLPLSATNHKTWAFLLAYRKQNGYAPTIAEIASAFEVSQAAIGRRLDKLQEAGWITRQRYKSRSIVVHEPSEVKAA